MLSPIMFLICAVPGTAMMIYEVAKGALRRDWTATRARVLSVSLTLNFGYVLLSLGYLFTL